MDEIPMVLKYSKKYCSSSSYGLKHALERYRKTLTPNKNCYISNGEMICAMMILGYEFKKPTTLNIDFKVSHI